MAVEYWKIKLIACTLDCILEKIFITVASQQESPGLRSFCMEFVGFILCIYVLFHIIWLLHYLVALNCDQVMKCVDISAWIYGVLFVVVSQPGKNLWAVYIPPPKPCDPAGINRYRWWVDGSFYTKHINILHCLTKKTSYQKSSHYNHNVEYLLFY